MKPSPARIPLLLLCLAATRGLAATEPKAAGAEAAKPAAAPTEVLVLPKVEVTAQRIKKIDKEIKRIDRLIEREQQKVKSSGLDRTLNNEKLSRTAAIFGGNSSEHLSAVAASRVMLLEQERDVLEAMKRPATIEELKMMEAQIEQLRTTRRNLDDAAKQR